MTLIPKPTERAPLGGGPVMCMNIGMPGALPASLSFAVHPNLGVRFIPLPDPLIADRQKGIIETLNPTEPST
jgi:hypothetical protein